MGINFAILRCSSFKRSFKIINMCSL